MAVMGKIVKNTKLEMASDLVCIFTSRSRSRFTSFSHA